MEYKERESTLLDDMQTRLTNLMKHSDNISDELTQQETIISDVSVEMDDANYRISRENSKLQLLNNKPCISRTTIIISVLIIVMCILIIALLVL
jgi:peptidoglycan hydrolase CwlO-like protein